MNEDSQFDSCTRCACCWCAVSSSDCDPCGKCEAQTENMYALFLPGIACQKYAPMLEVGAVITAASVPSGCTIAHNGRRYTIKSEIFDAPAPEGIDGIETIKVRSIVDYEGRQNALPVYDLVKLIDERGIQ